jgi:hypothetical protein
MIRPVVLTRRECLMLAGAAAFSTSLLAGDAPASHERDWAWLLGNWNVWHERLRDRLVNSTDWQEFAGRSAFWQTMGGLGNVDDNSLALPAGDYRGLSIRAFDPATSSWAIWWLDGRNPEHIDPPVRGGFHDGEGEFIGTDVYKGTPVTVRFRWHEVFSKRPHWDQAFSTDGGKTWEINWRNYFTRTATVPKSLPRLEGDPPQSREWDFLAGTWKVRNRRLRQRLIGSSQWDEFDSTLTNWAVLGGRGNIGDNEFNGPGAPYCGMNLRAYNVERDEWLSWWLDGRSPANIGAPLRGKFAGGVGTLLGDDELDGRPIKVRSQWTMVDAGSPRWEQAASIDGGKTWETNWIADFKRTG